MACNPTDVADLVSGFPPVRSGVLHENSDDVLGAPERLFECLDQAIKDAGYLPQRLGDVRTDCRRQPGGGTEAAEYQRRERRDQGR